MKQLTFLMIVLMLGLVSLVSADEPIGEPIGVFANRNTNCIQFVDPLTNEISPPLLVGELRRSIGGVLDVVITSDGKTAIVSKSDSERIFFIDISGGFNETPSLLGFTQVGIPAWDMDITPDDKYVLVTDGGLASSIAVVEVATRSLVTLKNLGGKDAQAVAVTTILDDQTFVLVADYWGQKVHAYALSSDGILTHKKTKNVKPAWPINIAISPDGITVIVVCANLSGAPVLYFDSHGNLHRKGMTSLPASTGQSCVFSSDGTKAYYLSSSQTIGTRVHILDVTDPGEVSASGTSIIVHPIRGTSQFLDGIDTIALDPLENYLYVTNTTTAFNARNGIAVLDLTLNTQVDCLPVTGLPVGIAFTTITPDEEEE